MLIGPVVGAFAAFLITLLRPASAHAGPDWLWMGGRDDVIRRLYFRRDGRFRRYGRAALVFTLAAGTASLGWLLRLM